MIFGSIDIPDELLEAQRLGKLVIFAGAGVSMGPPSSLPGFDGLAKAIAGQHRLADQFDSYGSHFDRFLGDLSRKGVDVQRRCREILSPKPGSGPTELHESLAGLFTRPEDVRVVTTNFDGHFRNCFERLHFPLDYFQAPALPLGDKFSGVVHLHGSLTRPEPLVLTDEDFGKAYLSEGWAREFLRRLFVEFTTLFVGYSHNDLLITYLARGMSAKEMAPRFALTSGKEGGLWASLKIREISFGSTNGNPDFENLRRGAKDWAAFTRQQPTERFEQVQAILRGKTPPELSPYQTSLLLRCLTQFDECHFFFREAKAWSWVEWAQNEGLLEPILDPSPRILTPAQKQMSYWLAERLLEQESSDGLLMLAKQKGEVGAELIQHLGWQLIGATESTWKRPHSSRWMAFFLGKCHPDMLSDCAGLLGKLLKLDLHGIGMVLFCRLTEPKLRVVEGFDVITQPDNGASSKQSKPDFKVEIPANGAFLADAWETALKPRLSEVRDRLLSELSRQIMLVQEIYRTVGKFHDGFDGLYAIDLIDSAEPSFDSNDPDVLVKLMVEIVRETADRDGPPLDTQLAGWLASGSPALVRVGLWALRCSKSLGASAKVAWIMENKQLFPKTHIPDAEVQPLLLDCYAALKEAEKLQLWETIRNGPPMKPDNGWGVVEWEAARVRKMGSLTWRLSQHNTGCPIAKDELERFAAIHPNFHGTPIAYGHGQIRHREGTISPWSVDELLAAEPAAQLDRLLTFRGGDGFFDPTWEGLLDAVGEACAKRAVWAAELMVALAAKEEWKSDLWEGLFWSTNHKDLDPKKFAELLDLISSNLERLLHSGTERADGKRLSYFLFSKFGAPGDTVPVDDVMERLQKVSLKCWQILRATQPSSQSEPESECNVMGFINHPAYRIARWWLYCCVPWIKQSGQPDGGFPEWMREPLRDILEDGGALGGSSRMAFGENLDAVVKLDPEWTRAKLLPLLEVTPFDKRALQLWESHLRQRKLSHCLVKSLVSAYEHATPQLGKFSQHAANTFWLRIARIQCSGVVEMGKGVWPRRFLEEIDAEARGHWARVLAREVRNYSGPERLAFWNSWVRMFWNDRVAGVPCPIGDGEAQAMAEWPFLFYGAFSEAVALLLSGPRVRGQISVALSAFRRDGTSVLKDGKTSAAALGLLCWLLEDEEGQRADWDEIQKLVLGVPRKRQFHELVNRICQRMMTLGHINALEFKKRCDSEFVED